jgi:hypothetical protein
VASAFGGQWLRAYILDNTRINSMLCIA